MRAGLFGEPGTGTGTAVIDADELAEAEEITAEEEYERALAEEIGWTLEADGQVHPLGDEDDPERVARAWTRNPPRSGWGWP